MTTKRKFRISGFAIAVTVVSILGVLLVLSRVLPPREVRSFASCITLLKEIDGAKNTWCLENHKISSDVPTDTDLFGPDKYIREKPRCPLGGVYTIGAVKDKPTCTIAHHTL